MAKGQNLTRHQQGIVKRYYENRDTLMAQKLGEIVTELYLATSEKKAASLWARADKALRNTDVKKERIDALVASRDVEALARLVNELTGQ